MMCKFVQGLRVERRGFDDCSGTHPRISQSMCLRLAGTRDPRRERRTDDTAEVSGEKGVTDQSDGVTLRTRDGEVYVRVQVYTLNQECLSHEQERRGSRMREFRLLIEVTWRHAPSELELDLQQQNSQHTDNY
jgi:hypothetical protein